MSISHAFIRVGVAAAVVLGVVAPAHAAPKPPSNEAVAEVAGRLDDLGARTGLAGIRVDEDRRAVTVHWKGTAPADVRTYADSKPLGVSVQLVEGARYSRVEGMEAAQRLVKSAFARQVDLQSVAVNPDGSGIRARVPGVMMSATDSRVAETVARTPVAFEVRDPYEKASRINDAPPWKGGIRTVQNGSACSTAFSVLVGTAGRLLSANHCDESANAAVRDGAGQTIAPGGASVAGIASIDSQLIDPSSSPATTGRVYTGGYSSNTTAAVKGWARNYVGQTVCASGASSGQRCGKVTDDTTSLPWTEGNFYIEAKASGSAHYIAGGDSGGPVFATVTGGVQARGVILAGSTVVGCTGLNPDVNPRCYNYMVYAPISVVLDTWGVSLETA